MLSREIDWQLYHVAYNLCNSGGVGFIRSDGLTDQSRREDEGRFKCNCHRASSGTYCRVCLWALHRLSKRCRRIYQKELKMYMTADAIGPSIDGVTRWKTSTKNIAKTEGCSLETNCHFTSVLNTTTYGLRHTHVPFTKRESLSKGKVAGWDFMM